MKHLKKLVRESIFKGPEISIGYLEKQIKEYFDEYHDILISDNFSLEDFSNYHELPIGNSAVLIQNLEDDDIMSDIANGDYSTFDVYEENQFNDGYWEILDTLDMNNPFLDESLQDVLKPKNVEDMFSLWR